MIPTKVEEDGKPPGGNASNVAGIKRTLSLREQEILMAAWLSIKGAEPQVDYEKLSKIAGLKNAHSANTAFYNVKKKVKMYHSQTENTDEPQSSSLAPKAMPRKRPGTRDPTASTSCSPAKRVKAKAVTPVKNELDGGI